jgi:hypothetical protein
VKIKFFIVLTFLFFGNVNASWKVADSFYHFFFENYDFSSSCHRNVFDYNFNNSNVPTVRPQLCYPDYLPNFLDNNDLTKIYEKIEQWHWISEAIKDKLPLLQSSEGFYNKKIAFLDTGVDLHHDLFLSKLTDNINLHGGLNRTLSELNLLIRSCPSNEKERLIKLEKRKMAASQAIDLLVMETPIITNSLFVPYIDRAKEHKVNNFDSNNFKYALKTSLDEALKMTVERRKEYTDILGTGIILGDDLNRGEVSVVDYKRFVDETVSNKQVINELLATSFPEEKKGLERLSPARCELQAKSWESDALRTKRIFWVQSAITIASFGVSSYAASISSASSARSLAVGAEVYLLAVDVGILGSEYHEQAGQCEVYKNNLYLNGESGDDYLQCLDSLNDIKKNVLIAIATGGISTGIAAKTGAGSAARRDGLYRSGDDIAHSSVVSVDEALPLSSIKRGVNSQGARPEIVLNGQKYVIDKVLDGPLQGSAGIIYNPVIAVQKIGASTEITLLGSAKKGGPLVDVGFIKFKVRDSFSGDRRVLDIGFARTEENYRSRGVLGSLYNHIFENYNSPPITAKKSHFVSTNRMTFTESLIDQISPGYLERNPIDKNVSTWTYEKEVEDAFIECCSSSFVEIKNSTKSKYDELVQKAFSNTPSGRQTIKHFPDLCENNVGVRSNGALLISMLHCM